jgi:hypothetical protein
MIQDKDTRDMQAYVRGLLTSIRREKFEERLQNDLDFKAKFDEMRPIIEVSDSMHLEGQISKRVLKDDFISSEKEIPTDNLKKLLFSRIVQFAAAASVMILIGIFWHDSTMDSRAYDSQYQAITGISAGLTNDECPNQDLLNLYFNKKYQPLLDSLSKKPPLPCVSFYVGMSYLGLEDADKAIPLLSEGIQSKDPDIKQKAEWYLTLAYLKNHERDKAKAQLGKIIETTQQHRYKPFANELLVELNKKPILFHFNF